MGEHKTTFKEYYKKHQIWLTLVFVGIATLIILFLSGLFMSIWTHHGKTEIVPSVVGLNYFDAKEILESKSFEVDVDSIYDKQAQSGQVLNQSPCENEEVKYGRTIYLKINSFYPEMKELDINQLLHISSTQALNLLQAMGFSSVDIVKKEGENDDEVIAVKCNGQTLNDVIKIPVTTEIVLTVSYNRNADMYLDSLSVDVANFMAADTLSYND